MSCVIAKVNITWRSHEELLRPLWTIVDDLDVVYMFGQLLPMSFYFPKCSILWTSCTSTTYSVKLCNNIDYNANVSDKFKCRLKVLQHVWAFITRQNNLDLLLWLVIYYCCFSLENGLRAGNNTIYRMNTSILNKRKQLLIYLANKLSQCQAKLLISDEILI